MREWWSMALDWEAGTRAAGFVAGALFLGGLAICGGAIFAAARPATRPEAWARIGSLGKRWLTLAALAVLVLVPAWLGSWPWALVVCSIAGLATAEASRALRAAGGAPLPPVVAAAALCCLPFSTLVLLRTGEGGAGRVLFVLLVVQMADVAALLGGIAFGRTPLAPRLSPRKTWEGLAAGFAGAGLAAAWLRELLPAASAAYLAIVVPALVLAGLGGDLLASALKRRAGLKDFGTLLPGHGGVLDRMDSYLLAGPVSWALLQLPAALGWGTTP